MATGYILTNRKAGRGNAAGEIAALRNCFEEPLIFTDVAEITDYRAFLTGLEAEDFLVLTGGDGTLHHFANHTAGMELPGRVLYYPTGTGNDFARELGKPCGAPPFDIRHYLIDLPMVEVQGKSHHFLNGIGFGIDGYCTEEGDRLREQGRKKINYTRIAIRGLLWGCPPAGAKITVDGEEHRYEKVWIAPTMFGKCYGGGMYPTPNQDRTKADQTLSLMVFHSAGKLKTLMIFPSIFQGKHLKHTESVAIFEGKDIRVEFDRPTPLQIDGETIRNVRAYHAMASSVAAERKRRDTQEMRQGGIGCGKEGHHYGD